MKFLLVLALSYLSLSSFAQKQAAIWYFGEFAGLSFRSTNPLALLDGKLNAFEGSATISDSEGHLLFYTDGVSVYNKNHQIMTNGSNLWGHFSTTQTIIIPQPGNDSIFYIFTASPEFDAWFGAGSDSVGVHYSVVNMYNENGLGKVILKNQLLFRKATEKMTATLHANKRDIWLMLHEWESNYFLAYLITSSGINTYPIVSSIGSTHIGGNPQTNASGQMKFSPSGSELAVTMPQAKVVEVFFLIIVPVKSQLLLIRFQSIKQNLMDYIMG